jgi:hypothetical protein
MEEIIVIGQPHVTKAGHFYIVIRSVFSALISFLESSTAWTIGSLITPVYLNPAPLLTLLLNTWKLGR